MSADPVDPAELDALARNAPLTRPRPGHADLVGHAEVRLRRGPAGPRAGLAPGRRRPGSRWAGWRPTSCEQAVGARRGLPRRRARRGRARPTGVVPEPDDLARLDDDPVRCLDPDASAAMVAADRPGAQGRRHPRRRRRGGRPRPAAGARLARALGPPARLPAGRRADGHPGDQGRRGRRRLRARGDPAARWRTTRSCPTDEGMPAHVAAAPAAPRAA